jgi:RNA 3'-terminal phosphate cyclase
MGLLESLLVVVIVLQVIILYSLKKSRDVQVAITSATASEVGKALDWIDHGLANSLENYQKFGE